MGIEKVIISKMSIRKSCTFCVVLNCLCKSYSSLLEIRLKDYTFVSDLSAFIENPVSYL